MDPRVPHALFCPSRHRTPMSSQTSPPSDPPGPLFLSLPLPTSFPSVNLLLSVGVGPAPPHVWTLVEPDRDGSSDCSPHPPLLTGSSNSFRPKSPGLSGTCNHNRHF